MGTVIGIAVVAGIVAVHVMYGNWLRAGIRTRTLKTHASKDQVRDLFNQKVARAGWKIVDDGNPMIAQSSLVTGIRQQIFLELKEVDGQTVINVGPQRWVTKWGVPKKGHTIRMRLNGFVNAVQALDASVAPRNLELAS